MWVSNPAAPSGVWCKQHT